MRSAASAYYMGRLELEFPSQRGLAQPGHSAVGLCRCGLVVEHDARRILPNVIATCVPLATDTTGQPFRSTPTDLHGNTCGPTEGVNDYSRIPGYKEIFLGNSPKPRVSIGIGVNWISPFGPLRLDLAKAIVKQKGDDTKLFSFNVGTQF